MFGTDDEEAPDALFTALERRIRTWRPARVRALPVTPRSSPAELRERLARFDLARPRPLVELVDEVADLLEVGTVHATHPRYLGLFVPGVRLAGVAGDALAAVYNPQLGAWWHAPAAGEIERLTLEHLARRIGLPPSDVAAAFTTGGSEANLTGVLAALAHAFPAYLGEGLAGLGLRPVLYASDQAHDSFVKIARTVGLGERALRKIRSDGRQRLDVGELRRALAADRARGLSPFLVVATVGTTATGAIDPVDELAGLCRAEKLWLHADAAWGGLAALSDALRAHVKGLERADSVSWDAHKTLPVPMGAGMFFCRSRGALEAAFSVRTAYVPDAEPGTTDAYRETPQWSRRFIGLKVFLTLAELGAAGVAALVERQAEMARLLGERLAARGWRVTNDSPLPLVCFTRDEMPDGGTAAIARTLAREGSAWISEVRLPGGARWLRACITHHATDGDDIRLVAEALDRAWSAVGHTS